MVLRQRPNLAPGGVLMLKLVPFLYGFVSFNLVQSSNYYQLSTRLSESERDKVVPLILEGYREAATEAGSSVSGWVPRFGRWCKSWEVAVLANGGPASKLMHLVLTPLSIFMSIYSILLVAGISASWVWKILGGCVNEKCALTRHTSDRRRLCKRCVTEKNLSWLAAAILPILSDSSWSLESLRDETSIGYLTMKLKVFKIFPTERRFLELSSLKHHEVKNERVPHSIGVKLHFSAGSVIDELLAWVFYW